MLNVVDRLEKRGWLSRQELAGGWHYWPTRSREEIEAQVAEEFVNSFLEGSPSDLMLSCSAPLRHTLAVGILATTTLVPCLAAIYQWCAPASQPLSVGRWPPPSTPTSDPQLSG